MGFELTSSGIELMNWSFELIVGANSYSRGRLLQSGLCITVGALYNSRDFV